MSVKKSFFDWLRDAFTALTAVVSFVAAVLGVLVLYASNKGLFSDLTEDFYKWLYDESSWTGLFNNYPEGFVDMPSMNLSDSDMQLVLEVKRGVIDGVMAEKKLCSVGYPSGYKLVRGDVSALTGNASITVWDIEGGYPKDYAEFTISRTGVVIEITPNKSSEWFGHETIRLAQHPYAKPDDSMKDLLDFCKDPSNNNIN